MLFPFLLPVRSLHVPYQQHFHSGNCRTYCSHDNKARDCNPFQTQYWDSLRADHSFFLHSRYESVVGTGREEIVLEEEKEKALTLLMNHYHPVSVKFNPKFVHMTQCMKIIVNDMTAKRAMPKKNTLDYKVMQFQGEVRSPHMYEEKNRS